MRREERPAPQIGDSCLCLGFTGIIQVEKQASERLFLLSTSGLATGLQTLLVASAQAQRQPLKSRAISGTGTFCLLEDRKGLEAQLEHVDSRRGEEEVG